MQQQDHHGSHRKAFFHCSEKNYCKVIQARMQIQGVDRNVPMRPLRVRSHFREFCRNTSLHGLQYIGEEQRPWSEKLCWILMIGLSLALCSLVIKRQWDKWYSSPVMVTLSEKSTPVWDIPFPAVTLCSEVKIKPSALNFSGLKLKSRKGNLTDEEERSLEYASILCDYSSSGKNNTVGDDAIDYLKEVWIF
ncbi:sodium channel protein Nach-like [Anabrus simplex]|uniref:sodium channel protein Nach-like n=1 Tax=Anabrus simplex TaxID=316456 RepID=UPI0035A3D041